MQITIVVFDQRSDSLHYEGSGIDEKRVVGAAAFENTASQRRNRRRIAFPFYKQYQPPRIQ